MTGQQRPGYVAAIAGIVIAAVGLGLMLTLGHNYGACQSLLGQIGQASSPATHAVCVAATVTHWIGLLVLIGGVVTALIGFAVMLGHRS